ncbi:serine hydrolase domain-containing protein [Kitasatospora sp. NPDC096140]|uniref:serine hydrolase domain-containing protein n=1 Tax=Kitasatospora sp. NPDC096140 TaxID=3155425 RepID=UPI00332DDDB4
MTETRRPRPAAPRSAGRATAALALAGLLAVSACSGDPGPARQAGDPAVTAEPAALSPTATGTGGARGTAAATASGGVVPITPAVAAHLDAAIKQVMNEVNIPGVIVGYTTPDDSYVRSFGTADKVADTPMSPDLYMRIGSVTKTFTTTGVLRLVDQGKVGLDDPISKYIPGVPGGDNITIRELGDMRSGLYNYTLDPDFQQAFFNNPDRPFTPEELLAYSFKHPANFAPNAKFEYSNTNLILLGLVVEKVGGQPLQDFLEQQVFTPAGLDRTSLPTDAAFPTPHAHGYTNQTLSGAVEDSTDWNPSWAWAAGAVISNLPNLQTWSKVLATGVPLISAATQAERLKTVSVGTPDLGYGFGVFTTHGWVGHNGSLPGYESVVIYLPPAQASLVLLLNTDILHDGSEPSTFLARAITQIVSPNNVYTLPTPPGSGSPSASAPTTGATGSPTSPTSPTSPASPTSPTGTTPAGGATLHIS